jgi:DNA-binding XRE family transcriptional regulator
VNTPILPLSPSSSLMTGLGQALRWLRERQARKQYRVADNAGITKGMLSAYETGRQRPSLESLEKLLETLGCDLNDLHNALQIVNARPDRMSSWHAWKTPRSDGKAAMSAGTTSGSQAAAPGFTIHELEGGANYPMAADSAAAVIAEIGDAHQPPGRSGYVQGMPGIGGEPSAETVHAVAEVYRVLGCDPSEPARRLPHDEEAAFSQILTGFHGLLRYWHRSLETLRTPASGTAAAKAGEAGEPPGRARKPSDDH